MCNLYTLRLSRDEVRHLLKHYKLIGKEWAEVMAPENAIVLLPSRKKAA
ncbi:MAG: hypothetical protein K2Y40_02580 [Reyranella sp.]|jgi:hypothetical protein|nr:hypothetical protein [Reyranella sp.]